MSLYTYTRFSCDYTAHGDLRSSLWCREEFGPEAQTKKEAIEAARMEGWTVKNGKCYCPQHKPEARS